MRRSRGSRLYAWGVVLWCAAMVLLPEAVHADAMTDLAQRMARESPEAQTNSGGEAGTDLSGETLAATEALRSESKPLGMANERQVLPEASSGDSGWLLNTTGALGVVIALIFATRWGYQKFTGQVVATARPTSDVEVLSRTTIAPRNQIVLLRVAGRVLVCSETSTGMNCLSEITDEVEVTRLLGRRSRDEELRPSRAFDDVLTDLEREPDDDSEGGVEVEVEVGVDKARDDLSKLLSRVRKASGGGWVA